MKEEGQRIKEQVATISLLLVKLLVQFDLSLLVDSEGNFYFRKNGTNIEAKVLKEDFIKMYQRQLDIMKKIDEGFSVGSSVK